jgi:DNA-binding response OmpR family regulator
MEQHVLVVEDHPDIAAPLMRTLQREGYRVTIVHTGGEAVAAVAAGGSTW